MSKLGSRVIGAKKAAENQTIRKTRSKHFGPRVIGDVLDRKRELDRARAAGETPRKDSRSDPSKRKQAKEAAEPTTVEKVEAPITANLKELESALDSNPAFYEPLYEAELARAEGPRKGALRLLLAYEMAHEDREDRKEEIQGLL